MVCKAALNPRFNFSNAFLDWRTNPNPTWSSGVRGATITGLYKFNVTSSDGSTVTVVITSGIDWNVATKPKTSAGIQLNITK